MRSGSPSTSGVVVAAVVGLALAAAPAWADVAVVKGGALRPKAQAALAEAERAMMVCWRGAPPATVRVAVVIDGAGMVTATAVTPARAAQCAAGVLAVWTVPGGEWRGELDIASRIGADDLAGAISRQFAARGEVIRACQVAAPAAKGSVTIKVKVHPDGDLTDVVAASKLGAKLNKCVEAAVTGLRLDPLATDEPVAYQLSVGFSGAAPAASAGPGATRVVEAGDGGAPPGSVSGPLDAVNVQGVLRPARPKLAACMKGAQGTLDVRFTIRGEGTTKNIVSKDATGTIIDQACVKKVIAGLRFPAAAGETRVVLPLTVN
jgi:hypothetical protein